MLSWLSSILVRALKRSQAHEDGHDHAEHDHSEEDPHIWLDPKKAVQQVENIRDALIAADPEGNQIYTANAADYITKLQALDQEISKTLAPYAEKDLCDLSRLCCALCPKL